MKINKRGCKHTTQIHGLKAFKSDVKYKELESFLKKKLATRVSVLKDVNQVEYIELAGDFNESILDILSSFGIKIPENIVEQPPKEVKE